MTDTKFKWLMVAASITIIIVAAMICFPKIYKTVHTPQPKPEAKSEYVFIDKYNILHADRKCSRLNYKGMTSQRIKKNELDSASYCSYCPKCVNDDEYQQIDSINSICTPK